MSVVTVVIAHREPMVAEGIAAALERFRGMVALGSVTTAIDAVDLGMAADAVAIDAGIDDAERAAATLRRAGVHVVLLGADEPVAGERSVSTSDRVASLAEALHPEEGRATIFSGQVALTRREREVLTLVAKGLAAKQVARQMGISHKTVERHKTRIFAKLGVPNSAAAVGTMFSVQRKGDAA